MGIKCTFCGKEFDNYRGLNGHMNAHREPTRPPGTTGSVQLHGHIVTHRHGHDVDLACTPEEARRQLHQYVGQNWSDFQGQLTPEDQRKMPEDREEAIDQYFDSEHGAYEEFYDNLDPVVDPTCGMEAFITSDRFKKRHTLNIKFSREGLVFDFVNMKTGKVVKTMSMMYDEIVENLLK